MHDNTTKELKNLLKKKKLYMIDNEGKPIELDLPDYGEVTVVMHNGKVDRLEDTRKRKV
ncbi:DUF3954 domain-containing protein [Siminovitchia terrae]|uniref:DUF3954 domain-containing protein n=1 Tax=Siminovitchia terrae TaxID=1914933 RepID=UPI0028B14F2B|nr:DUF3954 domain-containing protein [Siminovitchia terrae]